MYASRDDRKRGTIIVNGRDLFAWDLEATIEATVPMVRVGCTAAFSVEAAGDERLCIMAEHDGSPEDMVVRAIRQAIALRHDVPVFDVMLVPRGKLPKTPNGNVERRACRRVYARRIERRDTYDRFRAAH